MIKAVDWVYKLIKKQGIEAEIIDKILKENPGLDPDPVKKIHELEDRSDRVYLWDVDMTDQQLIEFTGNLKTDFIQKNNRDPHALHLIRNDVTEVKELDPATVREQVKPWLNNQEVE